MKRRIFLVEFYGTWILTKRLEAVSKTIADDAGKGAAIGAASGALIGGMRRRDQQSQQQQAEQQWANEQAANYTNQRNNYNRAYGACLEGRGYTVK